MLFVEVIVGDRIWGISVWVHVHWWLGQQACGVRIYGFFFISNDVAPSWICCIRCI
jgi:hypothetical protein